MLPSPSLTPHSPAPHSSPAEHSIAWMESLPFFAFHGIALAGVAAVGFRWEWAGLCLATYVARMFGITAGFHRYLSHRSFSFSGRFARVWQFLLVFLGTASVQKGPLWWAAHHRHHHRFSDQPQDLHSPAQEGFWWSHVGWILSRKYDETRWELIPDLRKFPELVWLNRFPHVPAVILSLTLYVLGGWGALFWGMGLSTVLLWHGTFFINSLAHVLGTRRYQTTDTSRNHWLLALITLGEGWHNNHHCYMSSTRQGFFWWEIDPTYYALKVLSFFGITRGLREPPLHLLEARRIPQTSVS
jgi:stearoyl-CoA desaturase (delta-9 desaturase)